MRRVPWYMEGPIWHIFNKCSKDVHRWHERWWRWFKEAYKLTGFKKKKIQLQFKKKNKIRKSEIKIELIPKPTWANLPDSPVLACFIPDKIGSPLIIGKRQLLLDLLLLSIQSVNIVFATVWHAIWSTSLRTTTSYLNLFCRKGKK